MNMLAQNDQYNEQAMGEEKKALVEKYVLKGYNLLYNPKSKVVEHAARNPARKIDGVVDAGFMVAKAIDHSEQKEGKPPFPDDVKAVGGFHLVNKLIEFAEFKGVPKFKPEEKQVALKKTYQRYMEDGIKNRTIDPVALAQSVEKIQPGAVHSALAEVPDKAPPKPGKPPMGRRIERPDPSKSPMQQQTPQQPQPQQQGLLNQPSPLEKFL